MEGNNDAGSFIFLFFVICIVVVPIFYKMLRWSVVYSKNDAALVIEIKAKVVSKREDVAGHMYTAARRVKTTYYVTFETDNEERIEFEMSGTNQGMLVVGDVGELSYQGTRYLGFKR
ncbi:DUF2500 domain-containing protein [Tannockella kyphosi]|uniref:DUF2500 domain-containing protein n=1 Tax=Tannockella kyphosi TaxID=2899121 RepID=UPI0024B3A64B|nr:DUF2500 domain-containing protein [Tannockella kyphosi]